VKVRVLNKTDIAEGVCKLDLAALDGQALPPFTPGAHIDVDLGNGLVRQYSLCNAPDEQDRYGIAVLLEPKSRGGSAAVHALSAGDTIEIGAPRNLFPLAPEARHSILVAGGIGITPMLAMAHHLDAAGASFEMHYCARSPERMAFRQALETGRFANRVRLYFDTEPARGRFDPGQVLAGPEAGKHVYVCGPGGFITVVLAATAEHRWNETNVHREYFGAAPVASGEQPFTVTLARLGTSVEVGPQETIVQALARSGVEISVSCEQGVCGTCLTRVLDGVPDHRDSYLMDREKAANDQILPCCSRAKSATLVLDL
jgi:vanillate O-demethylase ferredoxin subunit